MSDLSPLFLYMSTTHHVGRNSNELSLLSTVHTCAILHWHSDHDFRLSSHVWIQNLWTPSALLSSEQGLTRCGFFTARCLGRVTTRTFILCSHNVMVLCMRQSSANPLHHPDSYLDVAHAGFRGNSEQLALEKNAYIRKAAAIDMPRVNHDSYQNIYFECRKTVAEVFELRVHVGMYQRKKRELSAHTVYQ